MSDDKKTDEEIKTYRIEDIPSLEIPEPERKIKGEFSFRTDSAYWTRQDDPDKSCRWSGSSERFDPVATFRDEYGGKLQVTYDDYQLVLGVKDTRSEDESYVITKWWPVSVVKGLYQVLSEENNARP
jgi:hypothetical protein